MKKISIVALALGSLFFTSCTGDDDSNNQATQGNLVLNLDGLEELGADYNYEGWLIVDGKPVSTGTFNKVTFPQTFTVDQSVLNSATKFILTIEPANDNNPAPSETKLLAGNFDGKKANISTQNLLGDLNASSGKFILATPTDGKDNNESSGVWFLDNTSGSAVAGLNLPELPKGWKYEGWVVMDGKPVSTGTFTTVDTADDNATTSPYKGTISTGPSFPGEDYVTGSFSGIDFPTDLRGKTVVISVEPSPDNSPKPFTLKPLAKKIGDDAAVHTAIEFGQGPKTEISGTVSR